MARRSKNSGETAKRRRRGKPFAAGDTRINRKGRPPLTPEQRQFKELCKQKSVAALERLERIGKRTQLGALNAAAAANKAIIEHAWGKPKQELELAGDVKTPVLFLPEKAPE